MTPELFSDAMNEIGAKYVEEALTYKRPAQRSFWSKLAKRAAMVALVALLALSGFAAASPDARAAMIHWVETWTGSQVSYEYAGDAPTGELPFYTITALPDGYTLDEDMSYEDSGFRQLCYQSGDDLILFSYIYMQDDSFSYYDMGEDTQISEITVNAARASFSLRAMSRCGARSSGSTRRAISTSRSTPAAMKPSCALWPRAWRSRRRPSIFPTAMKTRIFSPLMT